MECPVKNLVLILSLLTASQAAAGTLAPGLESLISNMDDQDVIKVLVVMQDQPDIAGMDKALRLNTATLADRHQAVVGTLQETARVSQRGLLQSLATDKAAGGIEGFVPH